MNAIPTCMGSSLATMLEDAVCLPQGGVSCPQRVADTAMHLLPTMPAFLCAVLHPIGDAHRPPCLRTRCASRKAASLSVTLRMPKAMEYESKVASGNGKLSALPSTNDKPVSPAAGGTETVTAAVGEGRLLSRPQMTDQCHLPWEERGDSYITSKHLEPAATDQHHRNRVQQVQQ